MPLPKQLKDALASNRAESPPTPIAPLWEGPESDGPQGGVTQGLLGHHLSCGERFRLKVMEGWKPVESWNHRLGYGNMWHVCEEAHAAMGAPGQKPSMNYWWYNVLKDYARAEARKYPKQAEQIIHWYEVCRVQFPEYVKFWREHPDVKDRTPLLQEQVFRVPYTLPSGRTVFLRGKWDSVDLVGKGRTAAVYLQENKTKGDVREGQLQRQLTFDLQTMLYLLALERLMGCAGFQQEETQRLHELLRRCGKTEPSGVRFNVVRRPLSGGKGTIKRHQPTKVNPAGESREEFYARVGEYIKAEPQSYFFRWRSEVTAGDLERFRWECLDPVLENLCDDYEWWVWRHWNLPVQRGRELAFSYITRGNEFPAHRRRHVRLPYGVFSPVAEGGESDLDALLDRGSTVGLERATTLFPELE